MRINVNIEHKFPRSLNKVSHYCYVSPAIVAFCFAARDGGRLLNIIIRWTRQQQPKTKKNSYGKNNYNGYFNCAHHIQQHLSISLSSFATWSALIFLD